MKKTKTSTSKPHLKIPEGHVAFRIITLPYAAKSVIGHGGETHKRIMQQTGAWKIHMENGCEGERVIYVIGTGKVDRDVTIDGVAKFKVSAAQLALVRVYETIEAKVVAVTAATVSKCRLLVVSKGEVWKRDLELKRIEKESGAFVRVLPVDELPICADFSDDLIQIAGASLAVKKALIALTHCLQGNWNKLSQSHASTSLRPSRDLQVNKNVCYMTKESRDGDQSRSPDADTREVVFRLICPVCASGGLSGWKETVIKNLEKETGAAIRVSPPVVGCDEFVITVSAMENKYWKCSPAQNAAVCVFIRSMEDSARSGHASGGSSEVTVKAKLLVQLDQIDGVDLASNTENTEVQILEDHLTQLASTDEKIIQIDGDYPNVQIALFQVTWILRERVFDASLPKDCLPLLPHKLLNMPSHGNRISALTDKMNNSSVSKETNGSRPPMFPHSEFSAGSSTTTGSVSSDDSTTANGDSKFASQPFVVTNTTLEIAVREDVFDAVYGENGSNLGRLRKISGATVEIRDPSAGSDGKVIISGTRDQTLVAQSLLQAFLMTA